MNAAIKATHTDKGTRSLFIAKHLTPWKILHDWLTPVVNKQPGQEGGF
jgi:hypothetical protein